MENKFDFFNKKAETWDATSRYDMNKLELMLRLLYIKEGDTVLDVGTGTGVIIPLLQKFTNAENIYAIDAAEKMIEAAKKKFADTKVNFVIGDVLDYPFNDEQFDHIVCYSVFPHFDNKPLAIARFAKILKPGGFLSVLHTASKVKINGIHVHVHNRDVFLDHLPPAKAFLPCLKDNGMRDEIIIDNEEMYFLGARKKWLRSKTCN
ncbi:ubiquinone biosynthesis protein UbiE [Spirochaetia bacterium]|nr:ubiquinone biosynthesis protein UbiE [Spirochaetia bacterium]